MSYPTKSAFVHSGDWDDETRAHPAMQWMEYYTRNVIDKRDWSASWEPYHISDFELHRANGAVVKGGQDAWAAVAETYAAFTAHSHQPTFLVCYENDNDGWTMIGQADVFGDLVGNAGEGEQKVTDGQGKQWDVKIPSAFRFDYVKSGDGIKLARTDICGDTLPAVQILMKRGVVGG